MKRVFLLGLLWVFPACLSAQNQPKMSEATQGKILFEEHCYVCHGTPVGGRGRYAPPLSKENMSSEGFVRKQVTDGGDLMPGFKYTLQPAQINSIIAYLKTVER